MADNNDNIEYYFGIITNPNYKWDDNYKLTYLTPESFNILDSALSNLIRLGEGDERYFEVAKSLFAHHRSNFFKIKELNYQQPRLIAQKFIGRKKIRDFIFKRDNYKCLKCGRVDKLQIDHIISVFNNGENRISNLQTLCNSCNSSKRDNYKDYRNGAR